ncbi:FadR/GntR family transcriptional regulator [Alkalihalobacillus sp. AL-G]|uniref:FadR/GntR family transcriptional regulator n=1 Tax=Alkalihalobacillus sp. AL-G TaxID=2926399 RepID=UPI00272CC3A9|nr:FadR/GntR family transcriptional regulator [Alkalihalobacillus sp. AL-G]WLD92354.1 FadR family transcriptional regulator [Alkalihalobacillus sp. AL-G]
MTSKPREKVFVEILERLKTIILNDQLQAGDKLPSERELSERLNVGRSSVREALRAIELLGLIETRRGEGTYIKEARKHRLVQVLASFILNDATARSELTETRCLIERDAVQLASLRRTDEQLKVLKKTVYSMKENASPEDFARADWNFFHKVMEAAHNSLLHRLWIELIDYDYTSYSREHKYPLKDYEKILSMIIDGSGYEAVDTIDRFCR